MILIVMLFTACTERLPHEVEVLYKELPAELDFNIHVKPILSDKCFACHGPDKGKIEAGLQLHAMETAMAELPESPGKYAIVPGSMSKSELIKRILSDDASLVMPPPSSNLTLTNREKAILSQWIEQGAEYKPHWAFVKPDKPNIPKTNSTWPVNPIDQFVLKAMKKQGLEPSAEAEKSTLLRRLYLDLTGLPPSAAEIKRFLTDRSDNAYEQKVNELLDSPHYGEKMATDWMDLARYADTHGYQVDRYRDMSPWRTWVISAFNQNMPYDDFVTWQLAGDLMPNPGKEHLIATGFNRLHPQNMEGGIIDEEFRVEYVADRTAVLGTGLMAMTVGCARCHDHKYDPISQKEYYSLFSFFNNVNESGQISWLDGDMPVPTITVPTKEQEELLDFLSKVSEAKRDSIEQQTKNNRQSFSSWLNNGAYKASRIDLKHGLLGSYELNGNLLNSVDQSVAKMDQQYAKDEVAYFEEVNHRMALKLDGDTYMNLHPLGIFQRHEPFSISVAVWLPDSIEEGVIFHKCLGARLYSYKGYHLYLRDGRLEATLAHTWPDNAIERRTVQKIPRNQWIRLTMTYDGSSAASGLKLYLDGKLYHTEVTQDNLYKDIVFNPLNVDGYDGPEEPGLKIGARWRGKGIKNALIDQVKVYDRQLSDLEVLALSGIDSLNALLAKQPESLTPDEKAVFEDHFYKNYQIQFLSDELHDLEGARKALNAMEEELKEVMVMKEMPQPRTAYILERGLYNQYGAPVTPDTPENIFEFDENLPKNRLGLAQWLMDPDHPLTSRVAVNRYWQHYFGRGLVKTSEDFGNQGSLPSHPQLLDWLATWFVENGWDVKALQKLIVMSATYRQSSLGSEKQKISDPENIYLSHGPALRLTSEMIRDNALYASGLINLQIGGESVRPYQPDGLWSMNGSKYVQDQGRKLYRRSLYTIWKRTVPHPTQATFDQPDRSECTVRRQKTNTPLQALVLMNDPTFVEASRVIGARMVEAESVETGLEDAFLALTGRKPSADELDVLVRIRDTELEKFRNDPERAKGWLTTGATPLDQSLDAFTTAANAIVASVIMNSDAAITKR